MRGNTESEFVEKFIIVSVNYDINFTTNYDIKYIVCTYTREKNDDNENLSSRWKIGPLLTFEENLVEMFSLIILPPSIKHLPVLAILQMRTCAQCISIAVKYYQLRIVSCILSRCRCKSTYIILQSILHTTPPSQVVKSSYILEDSSHDQVRAPNERKISLHHIGLPNELITPPNHAKKWREQITLQNHAIQSCNQISRRANDASTRPNKRQITRPFRATESRDQIGAPKSHDQFRLLNHVTNSGKWVTWEIETNNSRNQIRKTNHVTNSGHQIYLREKHVLFSEWPSIKELVTYFISPSLSMLN